VKGTRHSEEQIITIFEARRGGAGDGGTVPAARHLGTDLLSLEGLNADRSDRSARSDVLLREEPDEEEDDEEDEGNVTDDEGDDDEGDDGGYSVRAFPVCQW
jgi:hypothetical protein